MLKQNQSASYTDFQEIFIKRHDDLNQEIDTDNILLHQIFEFQAQRIPLNPAVKFHEKILTYQQLDFEANRLANYLVFNGLKKGDLVGLFLERSEVAIISMLAIMKAGGGYVPIDPAFPKERIKYIFNNAKINLVLSNNKLSEYLPSTSSTIINLDEAQKIITKFPDQPIDPENINLTSDDLCYVIYTSGTTGQPKGVAAEHRNAVSFTLSFNKVCKLNESDRVFQGFSLGFDGSVEEIWMAFSSGSTLIIGDNSITKLPSEVSSLLNNEKVTFFSTVPTFLRMIEDDLPTIHTLIVSGEKCTTDIVDKWAIENRRLLNVYGPTETTVNATYEECKKGSEITIGTPLENYEMYILDEKLKEVAFGDEGELYIGGPGLARGYLNRKDLTDKQFIEIPQRIYKTGDLVKYNKQGKIVFIERIDTQVKIRGYRIELEEIENILCEYPAIKNAVVSVYNNKGMDELVAYTTLNDSKDLDFDSVYDLLQKKVPSYMIPTYLEIIPTFPTLTSGKINKKALPSPLTKLIKKNKNIVLPKNKLEKDLLNLFHDIFKLKLISITDDFFLDLGGHSLLAANLVSKARNQYKIDLAIKDIYTNPTIEKLSKFIGSLKQTNTSKNTAADIKPSASISYFERYTVYTLQALSLLFFYGLGSLFAAASLLIIFGIIAGTLDILVVLKFLIPISFILPPLFFSLSILSKWAIIGRFKAGRYPLWSFYYFRWWIVTRLQAWSGSSFFVGTPIMNLYLRLMGAKIGKHCTLDTSLFSTFDLLSIGENTSISNETQLTGYRVENGELIIGKTEIGKECFVGIHSNIGLNTKMENRSALADLSMLADNHIIPEGETFKGSPATKVKFELPKGKAYKRHPFLYSVLHYFAPLPLGIVLSFFGLPLLSLQLLTYFNFGFWPLIATFYISLPFGVILYCLAVAFGKYILLKNVRPGTYKIESLFYLKKWLVDGMVRASCSTMRPLYTTIYLPTWLRMLGAKIGPRAEMATVSQISPDLLDIAGESFFADGSIIGGRHFHKGHIKIGKSKIGKRSFLGNSAILPIGKSLGDNCLIGCLSTPPDSYSETPNGTDWLGSPSFSLPVRQKVAGFDDKVIFNPSKKLIAQRLLVDAGRILTPGIIVLTTFLIYSFSIYYTNHILGLTYTLILAPLYGMFLSFLTALSVALLKKVIMGTFKPVIKPLWSMYVWLNELVNGAYESVFAPILSPLLGTPFFAPFLRAMGCKIGKRNFIETTLFSEFDLVKIGDNNDLNIGVVIQNHLFEDRIMKSSYLKIGDNCSIGNMAVILYDTEIKNNSTIGPLSLLMKGETIPNNTQWHGIPTQQISR